MRASSEALEVRRGRGRLGEGWRPYAFAVAAPLVLFLPFLLGLRSLYWGTPLLQFYPWRDYAFEVLRSGHLPLWNPYVGNGAPLAANYQSAIFYPPNWLGLIVPIDYASGWLAALHLALGGAGAVTLARRLGIRPLGQVVAGLAFGLSQYLVSRVGFFSMVSTAPWLPWLVTAADAVIIGSRERRGVGYPARWGLTLAGLTGLMLLAGHAQFAWYALLFTGAWCGWRLLTTPMTWRARLGLGLWLLAAVLWGAALASIQLIPTAELLRESPRASAAGYDFVVNYSFSPWRLLTLAVPDLLGNPARGVYYGFGNYWEDAVYVGILPLLLALGAIGAGITGLRQRWSAGSVRDGADRPYPESLTWFLAGTAGVCVLLALGHNTPVFPWLYEHVPTFNTFQAPARFNLLTTLALALLAGIGADRWRPPAGWSLYWTRLGTMGAATLLAGGVIGVLAVTANDEVGQQTETLARGLALGGGWLLAALLLSLVRHKVPARTWASVVGAFVAADLIAAGYGLNPGAQPAAVREPPATVRALAETLGQHRLLYYPADEQTVKFGRLLSFEQFGPPGLAAATRAALLPNTALLDRLPTANNFDPLLSARYADFMKIISETRSLNLLRMMDVGVIASAERIEEWEQVGAAPEADVWFYRVPAAPQRWWVVTSARAFTDAASVAAALRDPAFDPAREVLLEADSAGAVRPEASLTLSHDAITMPVTLDQPGWVVLADTYYPGWKATVDGQPVPVRPANLAFRAVEVPAGAHVVAFDYQPRSFKAGWLLSAAGAAAWLLAAGWIAAKVTAPDDLSSRPKVQPAASGAKVKPSLSGALLVVVLPTYNEIDNLRRMVPELLTLAANINVIVVDDNSPDGTGALADQFHEAHPGRLDVIHRASKLGLGTAYIAGFRRALESGVASVLTMDADFSHQPRHIQAMVERLGEADLVIGSRYVPGGRVVDSPRSRRLLSRMANAVAHLALGLHSKDVTAGFRLYRREVLESLPLERIFSSGYSFLIEMLYMVERRRWRVAEVPIEFRDRTMGQSKISRAEVGRALYTVARLAFRRVRGR